MGFAKRVWMEEIERGFRYIGDKYVCSNCFEDYAIKEFIKENAESQTCDYCSATSDELIAAEIDKVIAFIVDGIRSEWGDPNNEGVSWESREGGWQGTKVLDSYDLIEQLYIIDYTGSELFNDIVQSLCDKEWCQKDPYGLPVSKEWIYDWEYFSNLVKYNTRYVFFRLSSKSNNKEWEPKPDNAHEILDQIGSIVNQICLVRTIETNTEFVRVRMHNNDEALTTVEKLGPPPKKLALQSNRMSPAGIPMFYGSFVEETALRETYDSNKSHVTIATFRNLKPLKVLDLSLLPVFPSLFDEEKRDQRQAIMFLREFVEDMTKPIDRDGREHIEYVPTQIITEYFRHIFKDNDKEQIRGIIYPSSVGDRGKSCVLFFKSEDCIQDKSDDDKAWLTMITSSIKTQLNNP